MFLKDVLFFMFVQDIIQSISQTLNHISRSFHCKTKSFTFCLKLKLYIFSNGHISFFYGIVPLSSLTLVVVQSFLFLSLLPFGFSFKDMVFCSDLFPASKVYIYSLKLRVPSIVRAWDLKELWCFPFQLVRMRLKVPDFCLWRWR